jgi:hypothetical protein
MSYIPNVYYRHPQTGQEYDYDPVGQYWVERQPVYQGYAHQGYAQPSPAYGRTAYPSSAYGPEYGNPARPGSTFDPPYYDDQGYYEDEQQQQYAPDPYAAYDEAADPRSGMPGGAGRPQGAQGGDDPNGMSYEDVVALKRGRVPANKRLPPKVGDPYAVLEKADGRTGATDPKLLSGSTLRTPEFASKAERAAWHQEHMKHYMLEPEHDPRDGREDGGPAYANASAAAWMNPRRLDKLNALMGEGKQPVFDEGKAKEFAAMRYASDAPRPKMDDFDRSSLGVDLSRWKKGKAGSESRVAQACAVSKGYVDRNYRDI